MSPADLAHCHDKRTPTEAQHNSENAGKLSTNLRQAQRPPCDAGEALSHLLIDRGLAPSGLALEDYGLKTQTMLVTGVPAAGTA